VLEKYPKRVKIIFKNFPLTKHRFAKMAAVDALSAGKQEKFLEFYDPLFDNFDKLNNKHIWEIARGLELDMERFTRDIKDLARMAMIKQDVRLGARVGVRGTPTIFINGRITATRTLEKLLRAVEQDLKEHR